MVVNIEAEDDFGTTESTPKSKRVLGAATIDSSILGPSKRDGNKTSQRRTVEAVAPNDGYAALHRM